MSKHTHTMRVREVPKATAWMRPFVDWYVHVNGITTAYTP